MTRPSFQFYPGDWQSNSNLRRCSHAEKGVWVDVMCLMHDQAEYGVLRWPLKEIAETVNCRAADLHSLIRKGVLKGDDKQLSDPFIYTPRSGRKDGEPVILVPTQAGPVWYSSRMVKDEYVRTIRAESAANGATPKASPKGGLGEGKGESIGAGFGPRGSSSSSSPSGNTPPPPPPASPTGSIEVFAIAADWQPSPQFATLAKLAGLPVKDQAAIDAGLGSFKAYWLTQPHTIRTQAEWEHALVKSLKHEQARSASAPLSPARRAGGHAGFDSKDYTAGVNEDGSLA